MQLDWQKLPRPIIALSPMADMTDSAFCQVVRHVTGDAVPSGYPIVFREMVSAEAVVRGNNKTLDMTDIHAQERPLVQQLFGSNPEVMGEAARIISEQHQPEGFDINMGCPVYKIVHNFNGAALMKEPELATKIIQSIKAKITVPLSVKIRLGWSDPQECLTFVKVLEAAGADLITIHGRTKMQGYSGQADWEMIQKAKQQVSIPVLVNGDIHKAELIDPALTASHCDGALIARGALGNPWIFKEYLTRHTQQVWAPVTLKERVDVVKLHLKLHLEQYGPKAVTTFRKHLSWYFKGLPDFKQFKEPMMKAVTAEELKNVLVTIPQT
jgi:nifR3 family TIM-barrel protein